MGSGGVGVQQTLLALAPTSSSMSASDLMVRSAKAEKAWWAGAGQSWAGDPSLEPPLSHLQGMPPQYLPEPPPTSCHSHQRPPLQLLLPNPLFWTETLQPSLCSPSPAQECGPCAGVPSAQMVLPASWHLERQQAVVDPGSQGPRTHQGATALALKSGMQREGNPIHG